jgi:hypothetical protein
MFRDANHVYECIGALVDKAQSDPQIGPKIRKSNIVVQFSYSNPDSLITINAKEDSPEPGEYFKVIKGDCNLTPDVKLTSTADVAHRFWQGKVNLMAAMSKKEIVADGPVPKILKLLPIVRPLFKLYPGLLREIGQGHLIIK